MKRRPSPKMQPSHIDPVIDAELSQDNELREEIGATVAALMPWGISILAHVGLIVVAFFLVWQTIVSEEPRPTTPTLSQSPDVSMSAASVAEPMQEASGGGADFAVQIAPVEPIDIAMIGSDFSSPQLQIGKSKGDLDGQYEGPKVGEPGDFFGTPSANEVVFLIDASGSMVDVLPFVVNELKRFVNDLQPIVKNNRKVYPKATVIFFSGDGVHEVPGGGGVKGLRPMTSEFKAQVSKWVSLENFNYNIGGRGSAHVQAALTRALAYQPELIYLLSDNLTGGGQGATQHELMQDDLIALIHQHNRAKPPARINTIQFLYEDPLVRQGLQGTLDRIAEETGGKATFITPRSLNLR